MPTIRVYLLTHSSDATIGYVGQTRRTLAERLTKHCSAARTRDNSPRAQWIRSLLRSDVRPEITLLTTCRSAAAANTAERDWIRRCESERGLRLLNETRGGMPQCDFKARGAKLALVYRDKRKRDAVSAGLRKTLATPEAKRRKAAAMRAVWASPNHRRKMSALRKEVSSDPVWRERQSQLMTKRMSDPTYREKIRLATVRGLSTEKSKRKRSRITRTTWSDPAVRAARIEGLKAAFQRPEVRRKKSEASQRSSTATWTETRTRARRIAGMKRSWTEERKAAARARWADPEWRAATNAKQRAAFAKRRSEGAKPVTG